MAWLVSGKRVSRNNSNGTVNNLVLIAWDNAGNPSADKPVPAFTIDQTPPTDPANVVFDHVIPTSKLIHATWSPSTDANGIYCYAYQFWYKDSVGNMYALTNQLYTTSTQATWQLTDFPQLTSTSGTTYGIRVWAVDNAINVSNAVDSAAVQCKKVKVGFSYEWCESDYRDTVHSFINQVFDSSTDYSILYSDTPDNSYDIQIIALPRRDATSYETSAISSWVNRWHRRLILIGESGDWMPTQNGRLNQIAQNVGIGTNPNFATSGHVGLLDGEDTSRHCLVNSSSCLGRGVDYLLCAGTSDFGNWGGWVANGPFTQPYVGYTWIAETSLLSVISVHCLSNIENHE